MGFLSFFYRFRPKKIKLGLALGSGGAKGFATLGVLRALEENNLEFDVVGGTSIGSIIGAAYADGYTSTDILELLKRVDFAEIKNLFMINMDTTGLFGVIDRTLGGKNIEELKKPFIAIGTEVETGDEHVFKSGSVATALCASSSYPPFFKPVVSNGKRYIDGAFCNSVPADRVKELGADFILGVDLSDHQPKDNQSLLSKLIPTYEGKVEEPWAKGYEYSDVMINPNLKGYNSVAFRAGAEMYDIGYRAAIEKMPEILKRINDLKLGKKKK
jgi:NTE family protein